MPASKVPRNPNIDPELRSFLDDLARYQVRVNDSAVVAPAVTDDADHGYSVGSRWTDVAADKVYQCVDATAGAAVWKQTG